MDLLHDQEADPLSTLEERINRAIEVVARLRKEKDAMLAERDAARAERDAVLRETTSAREQTENLAREIEGLREERKQIRGRIERLLDQIGSLGAV